MSVFSSLTLHDSLFMDVVILVLLLYFVLNLHYFLPLDLLQFTVKCSWYRLSTKIDKLQTLLWAKRLNPYIMLVQNYNQLKEGIQIIENSHYSIMQSYLAAHINARKRLISGFPFASLDLG